MCAFEMESEIKTSNVRFVVLIGSILGTLLFTCKILHVLHVVRKTMVIHDLFYRIHTHGLTVHQK